MPVCLHLIFIISVLTGSASGFSDTLKKRNFRVDVHIAAVANKAHSHFYVNHNENKSLISPYCAGYSAGLSFVANSKRKNNLIIGISYVRSSAEYDWKFSNKYRNYLYDTVFNRQMTSYVTVSAHFINYEIGGRFRLTDRLRLQASALMNYFAAFKVHEIGELHTQTETYDKNTGKQVTSYRSDPVNQSRVLTNRASASVRLALYYDFIFRHRQCAAMVFRNVGVGFKLPWWGAGISVSLM